MGEKHRKKLSFEFDALTGVKVGTTVQETPYNHKVVTKDSLYDGGHPWPPPKSLPNLDCGGPFTQTKQDCWLTFTGPETITRKQGTITRYRKGDYAPGGLWQNDYPVAPILSNGELYAYGSTGFARTIPTRPASNVGTLLGEISLEYPPRDPREVAESLRDRAAAFKRSFERSDPRRWMERARQGRRLGNELGTGYLEQAFGWFPFLSEVTQITNVYLDRNKRIAQLERDSGRRVRRRITLLNKDWVDISSSPGNVYPTGDTPLWSTYTGQLVKETKYTQRVWFSAAYTYYLQPTGSGLLHAEGSQLRNLLFGTDITPSLLWEINPWTWLIDYGTNIGDVMTNLSAFTRDNLVAQYSYVMCEATATRTRSLTGLRTWNGKSVSSTLTQRTITRRRARGNPYVFALTPPDLTASQVAVLAALGLTRI